MSPRRRTSEAETPALPTAQDVATWQAERRIATVVTYPIPPLRDPEGAAVLEEIEEASVPPVAWSAPVLRSGVQLRAGSELVGTVTGPTVIGRSPTITGVNTIALDDKDRSVSRNHLRLDLDVRGAVIACDLGSANGTEQVSADGTRITFAVGKWYPVALGDTIVIGDLALDVV